MGSMGSIPRKRSSTRMPCPCQVSVPGTLTNESAYHALYQCCGSASPRCGSGFDLTPCCRSGCWSRFLFDADLDPTFHLMRIRIQILPSFQIKAQTLEKVLIFRTVHFGLLAAQWCGSGSGFGSSLSLWRGSGSWFLFDADPNFFLYVSRIQVTKMMRIRIHNTAFYAVYLALLFKGIGSRDRIHSLTKIYSSGFR